jgi:hypothetical protein
MVSSEHGRDEMAVAQNKPGQKHTHGCAGLAVDG